MRRWRARYSGGRRLSHPVAHLRLPGRRMAGSFAARRPGIRSIQRDSARFSGLIRPRKGLIAAFVMQISVYFQPLKGKRNKIAKTRLTESNTPHICPLTEAVAPVSTGSRSGRQHRRTTGPPV